MSKVAELARLWRAFYQRARNPQPHERAAFYQLPLFVQWILGITFEPTESGQRAARRGLVLGVGFLSGLAGLYLFESLMTSLIPATTYVVAWIAVVLHGLLAIAYVFGSLALAVQTYRGQELPVARLDDFGLRLEEWAGR